MLWTEIENVTTKEGRSLSGEAVREWLRSLQDSDAASISATASAIYVPLSGIGRHHRPALRTPAEIEAWLVQRFQCTDVRFAVAPPGESSQARHAARSFGVRNTNDVLPEVYFSLADRDEVLTKVTVKQGLREPLAVELRVKPPLPRAYAGKLELAYLGAKLRLRNAIRSYKGSVKPAYRYLSRVRAARSKDGITSPVHELTDDMLVQSLSVRGRNQGYAVLEQLTFIGLEVGHGTEVLQACLLDLDNRLMCSATLELAVEADGRADVGTLRLLAHVEGKDFKEQEDPEFAALYAQAQGRRGNRVTIGVCDTGIFDDSSPGGLDYLTPRLKDGRYFDAGDEANDRPTRPCKGYPTHFVADNPSKHGTTVAGQAAWGSDRIALLDVMTKKGQTMGEMNDATGARSFRWAIEQGADIVNCSAWMPFSMPETDKVVTRAKHKVLFLATGGNTGFSFPLNFTDFDFSDVSRYPQKREFQSSDLPCSLENTLFVGGCTLAKGHHSERGTGPGVDVLVPSDSTTLYTPKGLVAAHRLGFVRTFFSELLPNRLMPETDALRAEPATIKEETPDYSNLVNKIGSLEDDQIPTWQMELQKKGPQDGPLSDDESLELGVLESLVGQAEAQLPKIIADRIEPLAKRRGGQGEPLTPAETKQLEVLEGLTKGGKKPQRSDIKPRCNALQVRADYEKIEKKFMPDALRDLKSFKEERDRLKATLPEVSNPKHERFQAYVYFWDQVVRWTGKSGADVDSLPKQVEAIKAAIDSSERAVEWLRRLFDFAFDPQLPGRKEWDAAPPEQAMIDARDRPQMTDVSTRVKDEIKIKDLDAAYKDLHASLAGTHVSKDLGASFGLPMVANIAAKVKLLSRDLSAPELKRVLVDTSDRDEALAARCVAGGVVNPLRAYFAAFDEEVAYAGMEVHAAFRKPQPTGKDDKRTIYYTFFYMHAEGLRAYKAIKGELAAAYAKMDVELIEAEPPVEIESEPLTYVAGRPLNQYNWKSVVPFQTHPLYGGKKHLRLILVNQCGYVLTKPMSIAGKEQRFRFSDTGVAEVVPPDEVDTPEDEKAKFAVVEASARPGLGERWRCKLRANDNFHVFPVRPQDILGDLRLSVPEPRESMIAKKHITATSPDRQQLTVSVIAGEEFDKLRDAGLSITLTIKTVPSGPPAPPGPPPPVRSQTFDLKRGACTVGASQNETWDVVSVTPQLAGVDHWECVLKARPGAQFMAQAAQSVPTVKSAIPSDKDTSYKSSEGKYRVERLNDREALVEVTDDDLNRKLGADCSAVAIEVNMVQTIGGNRDEKEAPGTIFVSNKYHAGPSGTAAADRTLLVLFLHEIGHALGMVPKEHKHHYDRQYGGRGDHCAFNTEDRPKVSVKADFGILADADSDSVKVPLALSQGAAAVPCVMYHTRTTVHHQSEFCAVCQEWVKSKLDAAKWEWNDK
ncbi:S8/S53 family peptidase [Nannocystis sp. RBIL2]|uniref:S8/S53 family peptidase n=1 Tax=Nannocystis sp. RBIL2 TaxID=2996788 RepID=UPI00226E491B|nr:S8/S53 family peptidase [Nannocystis sp. RBIL2]MCY1070191.1 S8/S53 family peptidase [Nannocystis sp. RBIL2]